jgi:hypothetical protein
VDDRSGGGGDKEDAAQTYRLAELDPSTATP